jgi:hypothetical protein
VPKRYSYFVTLWWRDISPPALVALAFWLGSGSHDLALAQAPSEDVATAEGWARSKISKGEWADFNKRCDPQKPALDAKVDDVRWQNDCRKLTASFLQDLLTQAPSREPIYDAGVRIEGARIVKNLTDSKGLDLENAKLVRSVEINGSRIETSINLDHAQTENFISFDSSLISNAFDAESLRSSSDLSFANGTVFLETIKLRDARIDGKVDMRGARVDGVLDAIALRVGGSLDMSSEPEQKARFNDVNISGANIGGHVQILGTSFYGVLEASDLKVGGYLSMQGSSSFKKNVSLS